MQMGSLEPGQIAAASQLPLDQQKSVLNTRQFDSITEKHKNEQMSGYYLLREQDRMFQSYCNFEADNDLSEEAAEEYQARKRDCILDILRLIKELGFPSNNLQQYVTDNKIKAPGEILET